MVSTLSINTSSPSWWSFEVDQLSHTTDNGAATSMTEFYSYERNTQPSSTYDANMENQNYHVGSNQYGFVPNGLITDGTSTYRISDLENAYINQVTYADGTTTTASRQLFYTYTLTDLDTGETSFHVVPGGNSKTSDALQAGIEEHGNIVSFGPVTSQSAVTNFAYIKNNPDVDLQAITDSGVAEVDGFGTGGFDAPNTYASSETIAPDSNFFMVEVNANETQSNQETIGSSEFSQLGAAGTGSQGDRLTPTEEIYNQTSGYYEKVVDTSGGGIWAVEQITFADGTVINYPNNSTGIRTQKVETVDLNTGESHYYYSIYDAGNTSLLADIAAHGAIANIDIGDGIGATGSNLIAVNDDIELVVCFAAGTMIQTQMGEVAVEDLRQGDMVLTRDRGFQPLRWVGGKKVSIEGLSENANLRPIRIQAGALGSNLPQQDLLVSPQHRVLVSSKIVERMFDGEVEVLVAAKQLVMIDGIDVADDVDSVEYFHFLFDQHEIVFSNGAATESLFTGPEALKAVSPEARTEILTLFPELSSIDYPATTCRTIVKGRKGRQLAVRHKNKNKPLLELH